MKLEDIIKAVIKKSKINAVITFVGISVVVASSVLAASALLCGKPLFVIPAFIFASTGILLIWEGA